MRTKTLGALAILVVLMLGTFISPARSFACTCVQRPIQSQVGDADTVFVGKVLSIQRVARSDPDGTTYVENITQFEVSNAFKGVSGGQVQISYVSNYRDANGGGLGSCGLFGGFSVGESYLVYAKGASPDGVMAAQTGVCFGTRQADAAQSDIDAIRLLEQGGGSVPGGMPSTGGGQFDYGIAIPVGLLCLAVGLRIAGVRSNKVR